MELSRLSELADSMPPGFAPVAESGVNTPDDVNKIVRLGYRVALIGTTLMKSPQPRELLGKMLSTGRQAAMGMASRKLRHREGRSARRMGSGSRFVDSRRLTPLRRLSTAGVNAVGFVFAESKRRVTVQQAAELARDVPRNIVRVAVMLHPSQAELDDVWSQFRPDVLQTDFRRPGHVADCRKACR